MKLFLKRKIEISLSHSRFWMKKWRKKFSSNCFFDWWTRLCLVPSWSKSKHLKYFFTHPIIKVFSGRKLSLENFRLDVSNVDQILIILQIITLEKENFLLPSDWYEILPKSFLNGSKAWEVNGLLVDIWKIYLSYEVEFEAISSPPASFDPSRTFAAVSSEA